MYFKEFEENDYLNLYKFMEPLWLETYGNIIPNEQIYYLLDYYFNESNILNFRKKGYKYFNIMLDEKAGVLVYNELENETYLDKLYILPQFRGLNIPTYVFSYLLKKNKPITLNVNKNNLRACKCYFKNNFEILEEQIIPLKDELVNIDYKLIKKPYKAILFDLDDTLLDFKKSEFESIRLILKEYNFDSPFLINKFQEINEECFNNFVNGVYKTRLDFQVDRFKILFSLFGISDLDFIKMNEKYLSFLSEIVFVKENAEYVLKSLSEKYDLYVCSNGVYEVQIKRLITCDLKKYFKDFFISSKLGVQKPDVLFFEKVNEKLNLSKSEMIIIGDRENSDILGGKNYNIDQILIGKGNATYQVNNLLEILDIL